MSAPRSASYQSASVFSERRLWAAVLLAVIEDYRREYWAAMARSSSPRPEDVLADLQYYFASRSGHMVCAMAGVEELRVDLVIQRILRFRSKPRRVSSGLFHGTQNANSAD